MKTDFILIAEDDGDDQLLFKTVLRENFENTEVLFFQDGAELLRFLDQSKDFPSCIFMDLNMPKLNGLEALCYLKSRNEFCHIPVIILSTSNNHIDIEKCIKNGAASYVVKPNTYEQLVEVFNSLLVFTHET
jgi:CheY-like chemotaxis protein